MKIIGYVYFIIKRRLLKRMTTLPKKMDIVNRSLAYQLAQETRDMAKAFAPRHTGRTSRFIRYKTGRNTHQSIVTAQNSTPNRKDGFNLPYWMHYGRGSGRNPSPDVHIKTGTPKFMFKAKDYLVRIKAREALKKVKKQKI